MKSAIAECALLLMAVAVWAEPALARSYLNCLTKEVLHLVRPCRAGRDRCAPGRCRNLSSVVCRLRGFHQLRLQLVRTMQDDGERDQHILRAEPMVPRRARPTRTEAEIKSIAPARS